MMLNAKVYKVFLLFFFLFPVVHSAAPTPMQLLIQRAFTKGYEHGLNTYPLRESSPEAFTLLNQQLKLFFSNPTQDISYALESETKLIIELGFLAAGIITDAVNPYSLIPKTIANELKNIAFFAFAQGYTETTPQNNGTFMTRFKQALQAGLTGQPCRRQMLMPPTENMLTALMSIFSVSQTAKANTTRDLNLFPPSKNHTTKKNGLITITLKNLIKKKSIRPLKSS